MGADNRDEMTWNDCFAENKPLFMRFNGIMNAAENRVITDNKNSLINNNSNRKKSNNDEDKKKIKYNHVGEILPSVINKKNDNVDIETIALSSHHVWEALTALDGRCELIPGAIAIK